MSGRDCCFVVPAGLLIPHVGARAALSPGECTSGGVSGGNGRRVQTGAGGVLS